MESRRIENQPSCELNSATASRPISSGFSPGTTGWRDYQPCAGSSTLCRIINPVQDHQPCRHQSVGGDRPEAGTASDQRFTSHARDRLAPPSCRQIRSPSAQIRAKRAVCQSFKAWRTPGQQLGLIPINCLNMSSRQLFADSPPPCPSTSWSSRPPNRASRTRRGK